MTDRLLFFLPRMEQEQVANRLIAVNNELPDAVPLDGLVVFAGTLGVAWMAGAEAPQALLGAAGVALAHGFVHSSISEKKHLLRKK